MPGRPPPPAALVARAKQAYAAGVSDEQSARELGCSANRIRGWRKRGVGGSWDVSRATASAVEAPPLVDVREAPSLVDTRPNLVARLRELAATLDLAEAPSEADTCREAALALERAAEPPAIDAEDTLATMRATLTRMLDAAHASLQIGHHTAAQRTLRDVGGLLNTIAREEKRTAGEGGMVSFPMRELEEAEAAYAELVARAVDRPLTCEQCGRELAVAWAEGRDDAR